MRHWRRRPPNGEAWLDSNIVLDVFLDDPDWGEWSEFVLEKHGEAEILFINPVVYSEVSIGFDRIEDLESALNKGGFKMLEIPRRHCF